MLAKDCIFERRSVRKFKKNHPIPKEVVHELLDAAMHAPSARNQQPWEFIVLNEEDVIEEIAKAHKYAVYIRDTQFAIVVCGNTKESYENFWPQDASAATMNLLHAAKYLGLGSVWCGIYPIEEFIKPFREILKIPEEIVPFSIVVIGYPEEEPPQPTDRFKETKVRYNGWEVALEK